MNKAVDDIKDFTLVAEEAKKARRREPPTKIPPAVAPKRHSNKELQDLIDRLIAELSS